MVRSFDLYTSMGLLLWKQPSVYLCSNELPRSAQSIANIKALC